MQFVLWFWTQSAYGINSGMSTSLIYWAKQQSWNLLWARSYVIKTEVMSLSWRQKEALCSHTETHRSCKWQKCENANLDIFHHHFSSQSSEAERWSAKGNPGRSAVAERVTCVINWLSQRLGSIFLSVCPFPSSSEANFLRHPVLVWFQSLRSGAVERVSLREPKYKRDHPALCLTSL